MNVLEKYLNQLSIYDRNILYKYYNVSDIRALTQKLLQIKKAHFEPGIMIELHGHDSVINAISFSRWGGSLASGSDNGLAILWDINTHTKEREFQNLDSITSINFTPDGLYLVTSSQDNTITIWNLMSGEIVDQIVDIDNFAITSVSISPNSQYLAVATDEIVQLLIMFSSNIAHQMLGHTSLVTSVNFSPDGQYLASASKDKTIRLWSFTGQEIGQIIGHTAGVNKVLFSPNGQYLASASDDKTIRLWNVTGTEIRQFIGHTDTVNDISFSANGLVLASASNDKTVRLWNVETGQQNYKSTFAESVNKVVFSADGFYGQYLAIATNDNILRLLSFNQSQTQPPQTLTPQERARQRLAQIREQQMSRRELHENESEGEEPEPGDCDNPSDFTLSDWTSTNKPNVKLVLVNDRLEPRRTLCFKFQELEQVLKSNTTMAPWLSKKLGHPIEPMGYGGAPPSRNIPYPEMEFKAIPPENYFVANWQLINPNNVYYNLLPIEKIRIGNISGIFGASMLHGQDEYQIYLVVRREHLEKDITDYLEKLLQNRAILQILTGSNLDKIREIYKEHLARDTDYECILKQ